MCSQNSKTNQAYVAKAGEYSTDLVEIAEQAKRLSEVAKAESFHEMEYIQALATDVKELARVTMNNVLELEVKVRQVQIDSSPSEASQE